jgi:putative aldouronate transport system substrate-binding protein
MKRILAMLLTVCLVLCLGTACGTTTSTASSATETQSATDTQEATVASEPEAEEAPAEEAPAVEEASEAEPASAAEAEYTLPFTDEQIEVTVFQGVSPDIISEVSALPDNYFLDELAARTGVKINMDMVAGNAQNEKFSLIVAGGDYPDMMTNVASLYSSGVDGAIADEVIIDHSSLIEEYAVNLTALMADDDSIRKDISTDTGNIGGFPIVSETPAVEGTNGPMIRQDWLDDLGLSVPETYDELTEVLTAFKNEEGATAAIILPYCAVPINNFLVGGYGIKGCSFDDYESIEPYYQVDGVVEYGPIQEGFKEYLEMLNNWYENGLLWQDFMSDTDVNTPNSDQIMSGNTGVFYGNYGMMSTYDEGIEGGANIVAMADQTKTAGETIPVGFETSRAFRVAWSITTACEYPELVTQTVDYLYSEEGALLCNWGVEDVTYTEDADGNKTLTEAITDNPDGLSADGARFYYLLDGQPCLSGDSRSSNLTEKELEAPSVWASNRTGEYNMPKGLTVTSEEGEEYNSYYSDIKTHLTENILKFVTGTRPISEFDDFVQEMKDMGIDQCIAIKQAAYDRYQERCLLLIPTMRRIIYVKSL